MNYQNLSKIAIRAIAANKMRSFLTALGWGRRLFDHFLFRA